MRGQLLMHAGQLCVRLADPRYDEPIENVWIWRVLRVTGNGTMPIPCEGDQAESRVNTTDDEHEWKVWRGNFILGRAYSERTACHSEQNAIPCPKVKAGTQTRYQGGEWQKMHARRGWIPATKKAVL